MVYFSAMKTRKLQGIPLAPAAAAHLEAIRPLADRTRQRPLFPALSSPGSASPTKTTRVRKATTWLKEAIAAAGLPVPEKPWQVGRTTCETDLNNVEGCEQAGSFVTGHCRSLAARSYHDPTDLVIRAVMKRELPPEFLAILNR